MEYSGRIVSLKKEIESLKKMLDSILDMKTMSTENVLEVSRKLDELIVAYYHQ